MLIHPSRILTRFVFTIGLFATLTVTTNSQISAIPASQSETGWGGSSSVVGTVLGPSGRPLAGRVRVTISTMTRGARSFTTDENGNFAFRGLPTGSYTVSIDKEEEFKPVSHAVDIRNFAGAPPATITLSIRLEYKESAEGRPAVVNAELADVPQKALLNYNTALEHAKKNEHSRAIVLLKLAVEDHPTFGLAFNELGVQHLRVSQLEEADAAFEKALNLQPNAFAALINRGIVNVLLERYGEAVPLLRKAIALNEQSAVGHYFLGQAYANLGLFDQAEKELLLSIQIGREEMKEAHRILAIIYNSKGAPALAAAQLETYLKLNPTAADREQLRETIIKLRKP